jgi:hypothetical protein
VGEQEVCFVSTKCYPEAVVAQSEGNINLASVSPFCTRSCVSTSRNVALRYLFPPHTVVRRNSHVLGALDTLIDKTAVPQQDEHYWLRCIQDLVVQYNILYK